MSQTVKSVLVRLRSEGQSAVVMAVPARVRETLLLKAGDMMLVSVESGNLVARKVDLAAAWRKGQPTPGGDDDASGD